ncbi:hypothetical protein NHX12_008658 [Muraenolepis orangiensis]|uniref:Tyrosine-protein kinase BAZ1B n=1 Tax=Muraenolepis orangiensis TaxID=630683 RepID=A0A9Q0I9J3_9TELE|nr:hypothetical protein NHX12_008658 [Muraenolepis orangiensis]
MAPLLGRKPYPLAKPLAEPAGPDEEVYIIQHTKEAFRNKEYDERIWTCKSTGSNQLTHSEAWDEEQEVTELLQEEYPLWFEKPVLEMVHHNTVSLDKLVEMAWVEILTKYAVDEECDFLVGKKKSMRVSVVKIHPPENQDSETAEKKLEGACDSPSSDRSRRSPRKSALAGKEEKKRWVMPKFLPLKYDVKLINEDKVISNVPVDSLFRTERPPTKEIMRYFIRHYALRLGMGESAPWVVEDELVKKFNLPSKFSDFLLDPHKFLAENPSTKRKSLTSPDARATKKLKTSDTQSEHPTIWGHMQKMNGSPLKVKNSGTPKKEGQGSTPSTPKSSKKSTDKKDGKKAGKAVDKKLNGLKKDGKSGPKMKQTTLYHLAKSPPTSSPKKRVRSTGASTKLGKPLPPMALHLIRYYKENKGKEDKRNAMSCLISKAAKTLSPADRDRLPEELKDLVQKRWALLEQKRRWKKREELKEKLRERARERREKEMRVRREQSRRYEDQELDGKSLPAFRLVDMPEGLPNALFGDVAMVVDFLNCYAGLLMPEDQYPITAGALMEALAGEDDELAEGYSELDIPLSEIPLTMHSVSELVRLCLRPFDAHGEGSGQGSEDGGLLGGFDDVVTSEFLERLETAEVFELNPQEKVSLLVALCHRILMTYSVEDHVDAMQQRSAELWKERLASLKEVNDRKRAEKVRRKEMEDKVKEEGGTPKADKTEKKTEEKAKKEPKEEEEVKKVDMISSVKSRRVMAMQAKMDKEEQDRQNKERMEKEAEEERGRKQKAAAERAFQDGISKAKLVLRRSPLGTDRNHNRYWLFCDVVPGLYIEKGWVHDSIDYSYTRVEKEDEGSTDGGMSETAQTGPSAKVCMQTTVPKQGQNLWFVCDTPAELEELMESLHPQGIRESELKAKIQNGYQDILHSMHLCRKGKMGLRICHGHLELLKYLRSDILEVASRLQKGGLGYLDDNTDIEDEVSKMESLKDFGECIITIQACVATAVEKWKTTIREAQTFSRMHVLLGMLDACIKWDMSAANARCKVCRKKGLPQRLAVHLLRELSVRGRQASSLRSAEQSSSVRQVPRQARRPPDNDEKLILCDECNKAFHLFCLRPALYRIPTGEWLCPACQPLVARRCSRGRNYNEDSEEEDSEEEEEEDWEEEEEEEDDDDDEDTDYKAMGHSLRPRKKVKQPSARSKISKISKSSKSSKSPKSPKSSKSKSKKQSPPSGRKQKSGPNFPADIDELELERCEEILQKLTKFRHSWPFRQPVSLDEAEDYKEVISAPMDFETMKGKFSQSSYRHAQDFMEDLKLVFSNAEEYNQNSSPVLACLAKTEQSFTELLHKLLPGINYLRRRSRKRVSRCPSTSEEEEKEDQQQEEEEKKQKSAKKMQSGKSTLSGKGTSAPGRRGRKPKVTVDTEEQSGSDQEERSRKRRSRRSAATSSKRNYKEQESDSEQEARRTGRQGGRGDARRQSKDEEQSSERHSKRQKKR